MSSASESDKDEDYIVWLVYSNRRPPIPSRIYEPPIITRFVDLDDIAETRQAVWNPIGGLAPVIVTIHVLDEAEALVAPFVPVATKVDRVMDRLTQITLGVNWLLSRPITKAERHVVLHGINKIRAAKAIGRLQEGVKAVEPVAKLARRERTAAKATARVGRSAGKLARSSTKAVKRARWLLPARFISHFVLLPIIIVGTAADIVLTLDRAIQSGQEAEEENRNVGAGFVGGLVAGTLDAVTIGLLPPKWTQAVENKTEDFVEAIAGDSFFAGQTIQFTSG